MTAERFAVTTKSGYNLTMVRILTTDTGTYDGTQGPVLLVGGPRYNSSQWIAGANFDDMEGGPDTAPQQLFDAGYDVWIAVPRGEIMSRSHETFDPDGPDEADGAAAYWNFGVEDIAKEDITAMINKILETR